MIPRQGVRRLMLGHLRGATGRLLACQHPTMLREEPSARRELVEQLSMVQDDIAAARGYAQELARRAPGRR